MVTLFTFGFISQIVTTNAHTSQFKLLLKSTYYVRLLIVNKQRCLPIAKILQIIAGQAHLFSFSLLT